MPIRSHRNRAVARSCVMNTYVRSRSRLSSSISSSTRARTLMSSAATGSSATTNFGSVINARAITSRCFCPPDRSSG